MGPAPWTFLALIWVWIAPQEAGASTVPDSTRGWAPGEVAVQAVRGALAERWGVVPESLVLEWGTPRGGEIPPDFQEVELVGSGKDGRWVVSFRSREEPRDARSVLLRAGVTTSVPVATSSLERGTTLSGEDMAMESRVHWGPLPSSSDLCQEGWVVQRRIRSGEALLFPAVRPPLLVVSGRPVQAIWSNGRVTLTVQATAVGSGALGERVFVRTEAGTRLDGVVQGSGEVLVSSSWMEGGK